MGRMSFLLGFGSVLFMTGGVQLTKIEAMELPSFNVSSWSREQPSFNAEMDTIEQPIFNAASDSVLIFTAPKTASTSLQHTLGELMDPPCEFKNYGIRAAKTHPLDEAYRFLKQRAPGSHTWVISVTRNPFARMISGFFQGIYRKYDEGSLPRVPISKLHEEFRNTIPTTPERWWPHLSSLGVNVTSHQFPFDKKVLHIEHEWEERRRLSFLIIRMEDINHWEEIMKPFFPGFKVHKVNLALDKKYADVYLSFLRSFKYSKSEVDVILQSDMMQFYTPKEIEGILSRVSSARRLQGADEPCDYSIDLDLMDDSEEYRQGYVGGIPC